MNDPFAGTGGHPAIGNRQQSLLQNHNNLSQIKTKLPLHRLDCRKTYQDVTALDLFGKTASIFF
ncbi:MAG: hypothetical protein V5B31_14895 [Candidatus Accumulibacter propinquus]|uniref:hypothetical protein n=1 Tax=Candidatus Accumulibacter propinquus TaxID=2954380 RepID=UPI002FC3BDF5